MIVLLNDSQTDGVISSYFTSERIKNMPFLQGTSLNVNINQLKLEKVDASQDWSTNWDLIKFDFYNEYHYPILKQFLYTYAI